MSISIVYPVPARKSWGLRDSYCWTHVGNNPNARAYSFFSAVCGGIRRYRHAGTDVHGYAGDHLVSIYPGIIRHMNWGSALGYHQFMVVDAYGRGFFYAHTSDRPADGARVSAGSFVAHLSNSSSIYVPPHLHMGFFKNWKDKTSSFNPYAFLVAASRR